MIGSQGLRGELGEPEQFGLRASSATALKIKVLTDALTGTKI